MKPGIRLTLSSFLLIATMLVQGRGPVANTASLTRKMAPTSVVATVAETAKPRIVREYDKLPLVFEANQGQTDAQVKFLSHGSGYTLFLTSTEAVLALSSPGESAVGERAPKMASARLAQTPLTEAGATRQTLLRMKLVDANSHAHLKGLEELPGKSNYFIGNDPTKWRIDVPTYAQVEYQEVYPGVNLIYYGNQGRLEHDFVVAPGADPNLIRLAFQGADDITLDTHGNLVLRAADGKVTLQAPLIYQEINGTHQSVAGHYVLRDEAQVAFQLAAYDTRKPLIIDPVLSYATYLGGSGIDYGFAMAVDASGNAYVTGLTTSINFPTANPLQPSIIGGQDVFIAKLNSTGTALVYSTYLGGSAAINQSGRGIIVDASGNAYVVGTTQSSDFPTTPGAFDRNFHGGTDAFVAKLNALGNALVYSTYLGGSGEELINGPGIALDAAGSAYVTGETTSADFPTVNPFQATLRGSFDVFVTKLNSAGSALVYSTYLGGSGFAAGFAIAVDSSGSAYVTGYTQPPNGFSTTNNFPVVSAFQPACPLDITGFCGLDAFVTKLSASGNSLVYSTFLGGSRQTFGGDTGQDVGTAIAVDSAGNAYVTGSTDSINFPTTPGAYSTACGTDGKCNGPASDVFITKFNANGTALIYSTYLGGSSGDAGSGIALDASGNAYVTGITNSSDFPTLNTIQPFSGIASTGFVTELNASGSALVYSTWLHGQPGGIALDSTGNAYVTGSTDGNFPLQNPLQPTFGGGGSDAFVAKICPGTACVAPPPQPPPIPNGLGGAQGPGAVQFSLVEPVSTGNGNYYYQHTDFVIPGRGMPLVFQRTYNTLDTYSGPLGANWTHSYNIFLIQTATGAVIKWGDGHGETFTLSGTTYTPQTGVFSTLTKNPDSSFALTQKNQTRYGFSAVGRLNIIQDKSGNAITLTYDGIGNLALVTDTVGRNLTFTYDGSNHISQITDPGGRTVRFTYNGTNDLATSTDPAGGITTFAYDTNHRVTSITQPNGQLLLTNTYDASGRVATQTNGRGFTTMFSFGTPNPGDTTITDARGNRTIHTYDNSLRIVKVTDTGGGLTQFAYDANNDRTSVTNQNGKTTAFTYDAHGNITSITDSLSNLVGFTYDGKNNLLTATNAKGKITNFLYDAKGNLTRITDANGNLTQFGYDGFGELISKTDARGNTTAYAYALGNLTHITDALGNSTNLAYDGIGRLQSITDANGHTATANYDALSRLRKIIDPLNNQAQFDYDPIGNLLKITDPNSHATAYAYDAANNLTTVTDALTRVTTYAYDPNNNRVAFTNAKGNATSYAYDVLNRLNRITDPLSFVTAYAYDAVGNVRTITDAKGQTNQFTYDDLNRLTNIVYADGKSVTYTYDANGNRSTMVDSHGTTAYSYDVLDRLASVTHPGGKAVIYAYDAVGNRKSLTYPDGKAANYTFDPLNRLAQATDWLGRTTTYTYDPASNLLKTLYPTAASVGFTYDPANRLTQVANTYRGSAGNPIASFTYLLDPAGNRLQVTDGSGVVTAYTYDPLSQLTSATRAAKTTSYAYDAVGNRTSMTAPSTSVTYSYDAADRLLAAGNTTFMYDANGNQIQNAAPSGTTMYSYDVANRLISATGKKINSQFAYDGDGNRITQSTSTGTYAYLNDVATALPVVLQEAGPDGNISYAYGLGLISETAQKFDLFYQYDGLGSVVGLTDPSAHLVGRYLYNAWGQTDLTVSDAEGTENKFRFTGEALDPGTGLYYLRARYYDPSVGRFLSPDPFRGLVTQPLSLNSFIYTMNGPINFKDPSGFAREGTTATLASAFQLLP